MSSNCPQHRHLDTCLCGGAACSPRCISCRRAVAIGAHLGTASAPRTGQPIIRINERTLMMLFLAFRLLPTFSHVLSRPTDMDADARTHQEMRDESVRMLHSAHYCIASIAVISGSVGMDEPPSQLIAPVGSHHHVTEPERLEAMAAAATARAADLAEASISSRHASLSGTDVHATAMRSQSNFATNRG